MDRIDAVRTFLRVLETGSFTRAAATLGIGKTSVSEQVARLEADLGVSLLHRTTRSVTATAEGLQYAGKATAFLALFDEARQAVKTDPRQVRGVLKVEVPSPIGQMLVLPHLQDFLDQYPGITLDLTCNDRISNLVRDGVDCALRGGELPDSSLVCRRLGELEFGLFASPGHLMRHGIPQTLADLGRHARIGYREHSANKLAPITLYCGEESGQPQMPCKLICTDIYAAVQAGVIGLGVLHASSFSVASHLAQGRLVRVLPEWRGRSMPLSLVSPRSRYRTPRVQVFMDWLSELVRRNLPAL